MVNVFNVAKKEFADLLNSWFVIVVLTVYVVLIFHTVYGCYSVISSMSTSSGSLFYSVIGSGLWYLLTFFGMFVGIVVGFASIASERHGHAINVLAVKPLYRDSIINGKLLGIFCFLACVFIITIIIYSLASITLLGGIFFGVLNLYLQDLWMLFFLGIGYVMIFVLLSMLVSIVIRNQAFALITSFLLLFVIDISTTNNVAGFMSSILSGWNIPAESIIVELMPTSIVRRISMYLYPPPLPAGISSSINIFSDGNTLLLVSGQIIVYLLIGLVACYISFIRRDIR